MEPPPHILLIGLRGSGKSSVGRLAAERLGRVFFDLDRVTPVLAGCESIAEAWVVWGQRAFRNAEARAATGLLFDGSWGGRGRSGLEPPPLHPALIALGGGTPTAPGVAGALRLAVEIGRVAVVYLRASPGVLRARLESADNRERPPITAGAAIARGMRGDPLDEIEDVFHARDGLYRDLAAAVVETDTLDVAQTADAIASAISAAKLRV